MPQKVSTKLLLTAESIDAELRPKLAGMLAIAGDSMYLLAGEPTSEAAELLVLLVGGESWGLIADAPADKAKGTGERYQVTVLSQEARQSLRQLLGVPEKVRKESTGRPKKYLAERDGQEIFVASVYEGQSIKSIARERHMSPTTVQKLLNEARQQAAANFVSGAWPLDNHSSNFPKNVEVLKWAIAHAGSEEQRTTYVNFLHHILA